MKKKETMHSQCIMDSSESTVPLGTSYGVEEISRPFCFNCDKEFEPLDLISFSMDFKKDCAVFWHSDCENQSSTDKDALAVWGNHSLHVAHIRYANVEK